MKILHIGNIANNAYLNAKILNNNGIESDVLSLNYYHIMGCPEWEDSDFKGEYKDEQLPNWSNVDIKDFTSPDWFIKGSDYLSLKYLILKNLNKNYKQKLFLYFLKLDNLFYEKRFIFFRKSKSLILKILSNKNINLDFQQKYEIEKLNKDLLLRFTKNKKLYKELFSFYDIIIGYGVDGIYPLLSDKKYIAFEHGTLRNLPFQNDDLGFRTFLTYKNANATIVTNADNITSVKKLNLEKYMFIPHPINETILSKLNYDDFENLYDKYNSDFIIFHPSRQHWEKGIRHPDWEKGNDIFIEGFAKFIHNVNKKAKAIFINWGKKVEDSKRLIKRLGLEDNIIWVEPMHNYDMIRTILSTDLVADQFYLGAFGSTTPKALMCGKPTMLYLDESLHKWCFEKLPPILNTKNSDDIFISLSKVYNDKEFSEQVSKDSREWYFKFHSNELIKNKINELVNSVLES